ncbi:hypothetical protein LJB92_01400 [Bacteroidales bacterium OttesenSCG-928-M06]|nr:hypothetical protein [Bacteroidales bacterium OttesenSCG-928-M06]
MNINSFLISLIPILSSVVCMIVLLLPFPSWSRRETKELRAILFAFCILIVFNWTTLILAFLFADKNQQLFWATLAYILLPIVQYHFVFKLTQEDKQDRFPWIFYLIPLLLFGTYYLITNLELGNLEFPNIYNGGTIAPDEEYYSPFMQWIIYIRFILVIFCVVLSFRRYRNYLRSVVHYSSELRFTTPVWILTVLALIVFSAVTTFIPMVGIRVPQAIFYSFLIAISIVLQQVILSFNLIRGNYIYIEDIDSEVEESPSLPEKEQRVFRQLTKVSFEKYLTTEKPYLNPELKITDMIGPLQTNRTYLSSFINKKYGMNFSRLINLYRLKEYDRLLNIYSKEKDIDHQINHQLIIRAGFGSYQSYLRAKKLKTE